MGGSVVILYKQKVMLKVLGIELGLSQNYYAEIGVFSIVGSLAVIVVEVIRDVTVSV